MLCSQNSYPICFTGLRAAITIGTALSASGLASYMSRSGRRPGLTLGYLIATLGGAVAVIGGNRLAIIPYLIGLVLIAAVWLDAAARGRRA